MQYAWLRKKAEEIQSFADGKDKTMTMLSAGSHRKRAVFCLIKHLSSDKALGADTIPAEIYKAVGLPMAEKLT